LELGSGTDKNTKWLLTKAKRITCIDFSEEMLNIAKNKIADARVNFIKADLTKDWEFTDSHFDLITSSLMLEHIEDLDHIFSQVNLKLKVDGLYFISELHPFKQYQGSQARFETNDGVTKLDVFTHHITDYIESAEKNNFSLIKLNEWFDEDDRKNIPRLISFVFKKRSYD
jgi:ubiquinone/menaquinone biosynthesis C-methylase UbiE